MTGYSLPPREPSEALVQQPSQVPAAPLDYDLSGLQTPDDGGGIPWRRYLSALKRYRWLILLVMVAGTGIGVFATRFLKQEYMVQATIFIESPPSKEGPMRSEGFVEGGNWVELVTTFTVLDSVVAKERLYLTYPPKDSTLFASFGLLDRFRPGQYVLHVDDAGKRFTLKSAEGLLIQSGRAGDSVGTRVGFRWTPTPAQVASAKSRDVTFGVTSPRDASMALRDQLTTRMEERGNFLRLILTGNDPARLTSTMNTLINQYVEVAAELKKRKLAELSKVLAQQVDTVGKQLKDAETRLEGFKVRTITQPTENAPIAAGLQTTTPTAMTRYFEQKVQIDQLEHDRQALEQVLRQTQSGQLSVDAFNTIPAAHNAPDLNKTLAELSQAEADLRALQTRYTDEYKPVRDLKQRIQTIRSQTIPAYTEALIRGMRRQENDLRAQVSSGSRELQQIPNRTITEQRLTREVQSIAAIYTDLQQRFEAARLAEASAIPDVRILDPAIMPERPVSDQAPRVILMAFLLSTALAFGLAILLDQLDKRFRYPEQVTHELGLSIFGAIPAIRHMRSGKADLEEASQVVEAFRTIRLNLVHSYGTGPVLVTISSPGPGDGKSLVSSNLALSFAEAGYKTLLVDGHIRRGELHRMFGTERIPGLIDYLARKAGIDDVLRATSHQNLALLPCGTRRHHGPELLGSGMMSELIGEMKSRFNVIIVDSPPLGAGIDPFVLGTATGNIMLVLRSGETNRRMAEAKVRLLDRLPIRVLGAVLNDIRTSESVYQHYSYVYGYVADEEKMPKLGDGGGA